MTAARHDNRDRSLGATGGRVLVTGSRTWTDHARLRYHLTRAAERFPGAVLVHGAARGADRLAAALWTRWGLPVEAHPADWDTHGRRAGYLRNAHMVHLGADVCVAFIKNASPGATACAHLADQAGIWTVRIRAEGDR